MAELTEEEQIEVFKRWWNENWLTIVLPIVVGVVLYVGWYWYQGQKAEEAKMASDEYEAFLEIIAPSDSAPLTADQKTRAQTRANAIVDKYGDSLYADLADLALAEVFVEDEELDNAVEKLQRVLADPANESMGMLAGVRLAKIYASLGRFDEAHPLVAELKVGANEADSGFGSLYAETRGDIYLAQGDKAAANTAYQMAMEKLAPQARMRSSLLQMKLSASAQGEVESAVPSGAEEASAHIENESVSGAVMDAESDASEIIEAADSGETGGSE